MVITSDDLIVLLRAGLWNETSRIKARRVTSDRIKSGYITGTIKLSKISRYSECYCEEVWLSDIGGYLQNSACKSSHEFGPYFLEDLEILDE